MMYLGQLWDGAATRFSVQYKRNILCRDIVHPAVGLAAKEAHGNHAVQRCLKVWRLEQHCFSLQVHKQTMLASKAAAIESTSAVAAGSAGVLQAVAWFQSDHSLQAMPKPPL